ncbi:RcnB family protein [Pseudomonas sp. nanlin1]|uniref:RcnB family protein n=1 Tax=Pseudomonas sp. nanlin1 TaxID=3040605 RepID=UPI00388CF294
MNMKALFAGMALAGLMAAGSLPVQAAQEPTVNVKSPGVEAESLEKGDKISDQYRRKENAISNWKQKGLPAPKEDTQWALVNDKYVLIEITNGTIIDIVPVTK